MRHTLKAIFDHRSDTQHVLDESLASGYSCADTALSSALPAEQADRHAANGDLTADSEPDAARSVGIIERFGPIDIENHEVEPVYGSVGAGTPGAATDGDQMTPVYPPGTEPSALQNRAHEDSRYFGTQSADSPPTGNTFQETMGAGSQWGHPDNGRLHIPTVASFGHSGGRGHDANWPAYRYGADMRDADKYRNRSWDEAEPSLKSGWERLVSDNPTWAASKPAIRGGWDDVTPEIDDDSYYRNHWTTRYANSVGDGDYDDYEPPYIYGSEARRSEKYRSRDWRDVESHLKAAREARHAGRLSSWKNFKDAVKHGWPGISVDMDGKVAIHQSQDRSNARGDGIGDDPVAVSLVGEWERRHAGSASPAWNKVKAAVRHGWDRVMS